MNIEQRRIARWTMNLFGAGFLLCFLPRAPRQTRPAGPQATALDELQRESNGLQTARHAEILVVFP